MKVIKTHSRTTLSGQAILAVVGVALLLAGPQLAVADTAGSQGSPVTEGVYLAEVVLASFSAAPTNGLIVIRWETESERYNAGFHLYRAEHDTNLFIRLNDTLIPTQAVGGATSGAYEFADRSGTPGMRYDYVLESVDVQALPTYLATVTMEDPLTDPATPSPVLYRVFLPMIGR